MKKILLISSVAVVFAACNPTTELSVTNGASSDGAINTLVWQDSAGAADTTWSETVSVSATSSAKEVSETSGSIACAVDNGSGSFVTADVVISGESGDSTTLSEGSSNNITIKATDAAASKLNK